MGGNALKFYHTERLPAEEYFVLSGDFINKFHQTFSTIPRILIAYRDKESFGDCDLLVDSSELPSDWINTLKSAFQLGPNQFVKNGNVVSIGYHNFQFDLIVTHPDNLTSSYFYFSYNDLGNLLGRLTHKLGIKLSHKGLSLIIRHKERSDHILGEITFSKDPKDVLDILGLSCARYTRGFDTLEEIFKYVASSKYFDPDIYLLDNRTSVSRIRDRKRATYNKFLKWIEETKPERKYDFPEKSELSGYSIRVPFYETEVLSRWSWIGQRVDTIIQSFELDLQFKMIYNGDIVSAQTGYTGKTLGAFMCRLKSRLTDEVKRSWIENNHLRDQNIAQEFLNF